MLPPPAARVARILQHERHEGQWDHLQWLSLPKPLGTGGSRAPWQLLRSRDWLGLCSMLGDRSFAERNDINQAHVSPTGVCVLTAWAIWGALSVSG